MSKIPLIIVCGPTASGKTSLAIELAKRFNGEVISADSMQIYKEMDIGTAKPDMAERDGIVHHLMDIIPPEQSFSVADYVLRAHKAAADITGRNKSAIVCGGTGLYIDSLARDVDFDAEEQLPELREKLQERAKTEGVEVLLDELAQFDAVSASRLHPNNLKRIIRAIEFYKIHSLPISEHQERTKLKPSRYLPLYMMIDHPRQVLYERIDKRVDIMLEQGLLAEAQRLYNKRERLSKTAIQAIGYKELFGYLDGNMSLEAAADEIRLRSRQYAKRQLTWFRRNQQMHYLSPENALFEAIQLCRENGLPYKTER